MSAVSNASTTSSSTSNTAPRLSPIQSFLSEMRGVVTNGNNSWRCLCPMHEWDGQDHTPSLDITITDQGVVLMYCQVCKDRDIGPKICAKIAHRVSELFPERLHGSGRNGKSASPRGRKEAEYEYRDADGAVAYKAVRFTAADGKKTFTQCRPNGSGGWIYNMRGVDRIPYRLPELLAADKSRVVFVVEGEKKVDALGEWGQVATCNVGGAGKWRKAYAKYFEGRDVVILPDNDPTDPETGKNPGQNHARDVLESLVGVARRARILELPGLPNKGDIVDWKAAGHTMAEFLELVAGVLEQPPVTATAGSDAAPASDPQEIDRDSIRYMQGRTDAAQGRRVAARFGQDIRFCHPMGKWYVWDGKRWGMDNTGVMPRFAKTLADGLWDEARELRREDKVSGDLFEKMCVFAKYCDSTKGVQNTLSMAASEDGMHILPEQLDRDPWLLNCGNGTLDLQTGDMRQHTRTDFISKFCPTPFDPDATCPAWERFLHGVFRGDAEMIAYIQRICGYWATGIIREQILPVFWGVGSNGKTTFLNAIMDVLGPDFCMRATSELLMQQKQQGHSTEKMDLFGRRLVACSETGEGEKLAESLVKELTGGERIRGRRMREDTWEFAPTHKVVILTNHRPRIGGTDHGIWRRIRLVGFEEKFWNPNKGEIGAPELMQDPNQGEKLKAEYPGILTWIVRGCLAWQHDGETVPAKVVGETDEYRTDEDTIGQWIDEQCECGQYKRERAADLYKRYKDWCERNGEYAVSQRRFGANLVNRGMKRIRSNGIQYEGIELCGVAW